MSRIVYNKEKSGKIIGRGGPRDIQQRQRLMQEAIAKRELAEMEVETGLHPKMKGGTSRVEEGPLNVDTSQYLPLSEVKEKVEDAVEHTRKTEQNRYESGLRNLNEQLNTVRKERDLLKVKLETKEEVYDKLQETLNKIYERVADGSITSFIGKDRPELEDKIFIDPIDKSCELDSHIEIKEEPGIDAETRDVGEDIDKLRKILKQRS